jgi:hypothetical protein
MPKYIIVNSTFRSYIHKLSDFSPTCPADHLPSIYWCSPGYPHTKNASSFSIQFQFITAAAHRMKKDERGAGLGILPGLKRWVFKNPIDVHQSYPAFVKYFSPEREK